MRICRIKYINVLAFFLVGGLFFSSCQKRELEVPRYPDKPATDWDTINQYLNLPADFFDYLTGQTPPYGGIGTLLLQDHLSPENPITNEGATLGRVLFYDKSLSKNNTISCSSCHIQKFGFSDTATFSKGFLGGKTGRHSMALANARFRTSGRYFWDGRAGSIEEQVLMPIQDPVEMGMELEELVKRLDTIPYYPILFRYAFGNVEITTDKISKALAQFVMSITSFHSKYDEGRKQHEPKEDFDIFSAQENRGKRLFFSTNKGNCSGCHFTDGMVSDIPRNNGLTVGESGIDDEGYFVVSKNPNDKGAFIAPSLRNVAVRPPYMHNGFLPDLKSVIEKYSTGITYTPSLDPHFVIGNKAIKFNLTSQEIDDLVAFLNTLTDHELLKDERFGNPFKNQ
jgi:cytochrome c peroxidase